MTGVVVLLAGMMVTVVGLGTFFTSPMTDSSLHAVIGLVATAVGLVCLGTGIGLLLQ